MAVPAFAQPLIDTVASIDSLVINADYVCVAKIIKVRDEPIPGGSEMPGFDFDVEEYLKVPMGQELTPEIKQRGMFVAPPQRSTKTGCIVPAGCLSSTTTQVPTTQL